MSAGSGAADTGARSTADAVARRSYGKLVAFLAARTRDMAAAEDALSEAFEAALVDWPQNGVPRTPEAWLLTVARRRMIDATRRPRIRRSPISVSRCCSPARIPRSTPAFAHR